MAHPPKVGPALRARCSPTPAKHSAIIEHACNRQERLALGREFQGQAYRFADEDVAAEELASIVGEACEARNGWKVILRGCAAVKTPWREVLARLAARRSQ